MRKPFIAGNWKMNLTHMEAIQFIQDLGYEFKNKNNIDVCIFPPFTSLRSVKNIIVADKLTIMIGAQNMHWEESGAFTGEISPSMLVTLGMDYVIVGHSERREYFSETNDIVNKKARSAFAHNLKPIMCVGESLSIRESGRAEEFVLGQVTECLKDIDVKSVFDLTIAYEPIWAIGTGKNATSNDANDMCSAIRKRVAELYNPSAAEIIRIQYGGSVKPSNITELMSMPDIDGALVGGASIKVQDFAAIINY